jgi:large subunit ribosomal protein L5
MHFIEKLNFKTLKYDLANKFVYNKTKEIPKLKKIILNFGCKTTNIKNLAASMLALELVSLQKGILTQTKASSILLKVRKGNPVGCKVTLKKTRMFKFLTRLLVEIFPKTKNFDGLRFSPGAKQSTFSYQLHDTLNFNELEKNYSLFNSLSQLKITFVTDSKLKKELTFILTSLQLPFTKITSSQM